MKIVEMRVVPVAMADPPLRSAFGLHAPYALRTIVQLTHGRRHHRPRRDVRRRDPAA